MNNYTNYILVKTGIKFAKMKEIKINLDPAISNPLFIFYSLR